jgi:hypothetical protein
MKFDMDSARISQQIFEDEIADEPQRLPNQIHKTEPYNSNNKSKVFVQDDNTNFRDLY